MQNDKTPSGQVRLMWRWGALVLSLGLAACGAAEPVVEPTREERATGTLEDGAGSVRLRLMAANITSGNGQDYDLGHGLRIFQGTAPDVVMIQEFSYQTSSEADLRSFVDTAFGPDFHYYREGGAQIPNGVISRWPIIAAGEWDDPYVSNRDFAWARIDVPGPRDLWVVSVHLLTTGSSTRNSEASSLVNRIKASIPAGDYLAIGGDFNTGSRSEACFSTFSQVVTTASPYPADRNNNTNTNASRNAPYDHVLVDADLRQYQTAVVIGDSVFEDGLVVDTRVYSPISELSPALSTDSGASSMQHMGVIKDFLIPADAESGNVTVTAPNGGESWAGGGMRTITWTASGVTNVTLEYTLDGSTWSTLTPDETGIAASAGSFAWTVPSTASTAARVRVSDAAGTGVTDTSDGAFTITVSSGTANVIVNEVLANEPGTNVAGEFVELVNVGTAAADLSGWKVADAALVRHTFPSGTTLAAGQALVVFAGSAGIPAGTPGAVVASTGSLGLSNSGDTVTLKDAAGTTVDTATLGSPLCGTDGVSANRSPDASSGATFVLHTGVSSLASSPGRRASGAAF